MLDLQNPEDLMIRRILLTLAGLTFAGFLVTAITIAAMVSSNFNFLNWME